MHTDIAIEIRKGSQFMKWQPTPEQLLGHTPEALAKKLRDMIELVEYMFNLQANQANKDLIQIETQ